MELKENDYILGYWFASDHSSNCWYTMVIKRGDKWLVQQTFRYNKEPEGEFDPFSGKDKKNRTDFEIAGDADENSVIEKMNKIWEVIKIKYPSYSDMFLVQGDIAKFFDIAKTKHYLHMKQVDKEQYEREIT